MEIKETSHTLKCDLPVLPSTTSPFECVFPHSADALWCYCCCCYLFKSDEMNRRETAICKHHSNESVCKCDGFHVAWSYRRKVILESQICIFKFRKRFRFCEKEEKEGKVDKNFIFFLHSSAWKFIMDFFLPSSHINNRALRIVIIISLLTVMG